MSAPWYALSIPAHYSTFNPASHKKLSTTTLSHALYPETTLQIYIMHLMRNSLSNARWRDGKPLAVVVKPI